MKRAIVVHGWSGSPDSDWMPWAKKELEAKGYQVTVPAMPEPDHPKMDVWISYLKEVVGEVDGSTILIGHSMGCRTILGFLQTLPGEEKVNKVILVAGWVSLTPLATETAEEKKVAREWLERPFNWQKIKSHALDFVAIFSDDDPYVLFWENSQAYKDNLNAKIILEKGCGHFSEDTGVTTLPVLLEYC